MTLTPQQFTAKWRGVTLKERSAAQEHFIDLCRLLGRQKLDHAVLTAYDWPDDLSDGEILEHLLALNLQRVGAEA